MRKDLMTVREAASHLGVHQHVVRDAIKRQRLKSTRYGWMILVYRSSVERLQRERAARSA